jgi:hypothetical protein
MDKIFVLRRKKFGRIDSWGRIFSQPGNELGVSSFLAKNKLLNAFLLYLVPSCEQACSQID